MAEQTFVSCTGGGPIRVHVEDGKITRVRPLVFDETDAPSWTLDIDGQEYTPYRKACVALSRSWRGPGSIPTSVSCTR